MSPGSDIQEDDDFGSGSGVYGLDDEDDVDGRTLLLAYLKHDLKSWSVRWSDLLKIRCFGSKPS